MDRADAVELYTDIHRMRAKNDRDAITPLFSEDAEFCMTGEARENSIAMGHIHAKLADVIDALIAEWEWVNYDIKTILVDGDQIAARTLVTVRHVPTDTVFDTELADFIDVRDGKVVMMREYCDTAHVGAIARSKA